MTVARLEMQAQTTPMVILPNEINGNVKLDISAIPNLDIEKFDYQYMSVFVKNEVEEYSTNAVQGRYTIENGYLVFSPYFPFERGMNYVVRTKNAVLDSNYSYQSFQVGKKEVVDKAKVLSIYPSGNELPENVLRFYLYFNTPMKKGQALKHVQLIDSAGNVDNYAFMEFKQELWSADGKRLTILFDPGRIKRGVSTNLELGPALMEGKRYYLSISNEWQDVYDQSLIEEFKKKFVVSQAYRNSIKIHEWGLDKPKGERPLVLHFDRIIDHALLQSMIQIEDQEKNLVAGHWEILENEKSIQFIHEKKWQNGSYKIVLDERLEDAAGNNLQSLLDEKVTLHKQSKKKASFLKFTLN